MCSSGSGLRGLHSRLRARGLACDADAMPSACSGFRVQLCYILHLAVKF